MLRRAMEPALRRAASQMPVVTVVGPRQSGKTTLLQHCFGERTYVSTTHIGLLSGSEKPPNRKPPS